MNKVQETPLSHYEVEELACKILGLDYDEIDADSEVIEAKLYDDLNMEWDSFQTVIQRLLPLIEKAKSGLTEETYVGFADKENGVWLVKTPVPKESKQD